MNDSAAFDLAVIGAGPGGYVAAIRAAQLGKRVVVIDDEGHPGGTCLNWGCIPSKALLKAAERREFLKEAGSFGFGVTESSFDLQKIIGRSRDVVSKLNRGIEFLFKKNKIEYKVGRARIVMPGKIAVGGETIQAGRILIATGAKPRLLPGVKPDGRRILTSREALLLAEPPASLAVLGAGAIGMEFAYFFHAFGTRVTVIELLDRILPQEDREISAALRKIYEKAGMKILTGARVDAVRVEGDGVRLELDRDGKKETHDAGAALLALGVVPNTEGLFEEGVRVKEEKGWISVNDDFQTSLPGIHAIGDIIGPPWLAHVASHEGIVAVERMFTDHRPKIRYDVIPACTYCRPQVASVGLTEEAVRKQYGDAVQIGRFPFQALGKAIASDETEGFVKLIFAGPHAQLVGAHILGHEATEMIAELGMALSLEATRDDILATVHAHPTMAEAILEAALASAGRAIHL
ncbi:dihydrolipoyl dehydrogenase [bacterium]|nr:dihydrolipoyl dehydrogenase [bacterium]